MTKYYLRNTQLIIWEDDWDISTTQLRALKTDVRTTEDGSKPTHQEGESRPQQTKTWTYATDTQPFTDEPTTATMPLLWDCNTYCYTHITGLPLFDWHETGSWHHVTNERITNEKRKLFKNIWLFKKCWDLQ